MSAVATVYHRINPSFDPGEPVRMGPDGPIDLLEVATVEREGNHDVASLREYAFLHTSDGSWWLKPAEGVTPTEGPHRATSVGDVIEVDGQWWSRKPAGWTLPIIDRTLEALGKGMIVFGPLPSGKKK